MLPIIFLSILYITAVTNAEVTDCESPAGKRSTIVISSCNITDTRCILPRGTRNQPSVVNMEIGFTITKPIKFVKVVVYGIIAGIPIPFTVPHPNVCDDPHAGVNCPLLNTSDIYKYNFSLPIYFAYPPISVTTQLKLQNENEEDIVCLLIPSRLE